MKTGLGFLSSSFTTSVGFKYWRPFTSVDHIEASRVSCLGSSNPASLVAQGWFAVQPIFSTIMINNICSTVSDIGE